MNPIDIDKIDKLLADVRAAFMHVRTKVDDVVNRDVSSIVQAEIQRLIADTTTVEDAVQVVRKPVKGYEGYYEVDQFGRVFGLERIIKVNDNGRNYEKPIAGKQLKQSMHTKGYKTVSLTKDGKTTETAEPQPDGIQVRTVDDLGRICIPKDIRDKLGIKPGTECAVYATDELTPEEIIVIRRKENDKTN